MTNGEQYNDFYDILPDELKKRVFDAIESYSPEESNDNGSFADLGEEDIDIRLTTYEASKGLSAQHVYILGIQEGDLPQDKNNISDLEICKIIVAITRARKQCTLITFRNFLGTWKRKSIFMDWISDSLQYICVDKGYFT